MKSNKRIDYFDIAKGIGMLLVIIGHMPLGDYPMIRTFIYSFHMPLFFLISGYFFKQRENKDCLKNIFRHLILPYIITCLVMIGYLILKNVIVEKSIVQIPSILKTWSLAALYGKGSGTEFGIIPIGAIWFLLALSFSTYFMNILYNNKYRALWIIAIAFVGYKTAQYFWLPFSIQAGMTALFFMYLGVLAKENDILNIKINWILYSFLIFTTVFCTMYCGKLFMVKNIFENGIIDIIGALSGSILCIKFSMIIDKFSKYIKKFLVFMGRNSLIAMCAHLFSLNCIGWTFAFKMFSKIGMDNRMICATLVNIIWVLIVLIILKIVIPKIKEIIKSKTIKNEIG